MIHEIGYIYVFALAINTLVPYTFDLNDNITKFVFGPSFVLGLVKENGLSVEDKLYTELVFVLILFNQKR